MDTKTKRVVISGYYGFRNSGDEAVLQSILLALEEEGSRIGTTIEPVVLSIDPEWTSRIYGVKAVHRMKPDQVRQAIRNSDGLISGGGSLLQDATGWKSIPYYLAVLKLAQWAGKSTFIYSQGVGPVNRKLFFPMIRHVFNRCRYISVRDKESAELLARMGVDKMSIEIVPDPVMGMPRRDGSAASTRSDEADVIGVSVRYWNQDHSELKKLADALRLIVERRAVKIRLLSFHLPADEEASREIVKWMGAANHPDVEVVGGITHPQDMLEQVSRCDLLIGMRLHSLIYAASQSVPLIGISYDPKIDQFLYRLDMQAVGNTTNLSMEALLSWMEGLLDGKKEWIEAKKPLIEQLKTQARQPATRIVEFLASN